MARVFLARVHPVWVVGVESYPTTAASVCCRAEPLFSPNLDTCFQAHAAFGYFPVLLDTAMSVAVLPSQVNSRLQNCL